MTPLRRILVVLLVGAGSSLAGEFGSYPESNVQQHLQVLAFGSCAKERLPQPIWDEIGVHEPDMFLFIGDNQYADRWDHDGDGDVEMRPVTEASRFKEAYEVLAAKPQFQAFRKKTPFMATWDDHDFGANDAGKEYPMRAEAQVAFWDFFGLPADDELRQREGVYHSRMFGPPGQRVQFIMTDTRSFRDPLDRNPDRGERGPYMPTNDTSRTLLGDAQWQWLEGELKKEADLRIIASSIQVIAYEHGWETWGNFPHEQQRLYDLIQETQADGVIIISGDRHLTELSLEDGQADANVGYPLWDFTSSGMTDDIRVVTDPNRFRQGPVHRGTNYGIIRLDWSEDSPGLDGLTVIFESWGQNENLIFRQEIAGASLRL